MHPRPYLALAVIALLAGPSLAVAQSAAPAAPPVDNPELAKLYQEDQADREGGPNSVKDWAAVSKRDGERRARVQAIVAEGGARTAEDLFHAAMVYQHGEAVADFEEAHRLAAEAAKLDPSHETALWLAAAAKDRSLMNQGKPQLYGTQFKKVDGKWVLWEVDPSITDEERARWHVPPIAKARERVELLNAEQKP
jgi:hypothetical protein